MRIGMYINEEEAIGEQLKTGDKVKLVESSTPILGGECDYPYRFNDKKGKGVYIPSGTILKRGGNYFRVEVKQDKSIENVSCCGYHKHSLTLERLERKRLPEKLMDFFNTSPTFIITAY